MARAQPPQHSHDAGDPKVPGETDAAALARARGYPYARPDRSFIWVNGPRVGHAAYTLADGCCWSPPRDWPAGSLQPLLDLRVDAPPGAQQQQQQQQQSSSQTLARVLAAHGVALPSPAVLAPGTPLTPVLAIGSNAGPEQLARKFPLSLFPDGVVVPVIACVLRHFDVVFAPLISSYASCTATLEASPGTEVEVFLTYLTPRLEQRMHETEGAYHLVRLDDVELLEGVGLRAHMSGAAAPAATLSSVLQYNHQAGTLWMPLEQAGSTPVGLAEIPARQRRFPALTQVQQQAALRWALAEVTPDHVEAATQPAAAAQLRTVPQQQQQQQEEDAGLDAWIQENLHDHTLRRARVAALTAAARPFGYEACETVLVIGTTMSTSVK